MAINQSHFYYALISLEIAACHQENLDFFITNFVSVSCYTAKFDNSNLVGVIHELFLQASSD